LACVESSARSGAARMVLALRLLASALRTVTGDAFLLSFASPLLSSTLGSDVIGARLQSYSAVFAGPRSSSLSSLSSPLLDLGHLHVFGLPAWCCQAHAPLPSLSFDRRTATLSGRVCGRVRGVIGPARSSLPAWGKPWRYSLTWSSLGHGSVGVSTRSNQQPWGRASRQRMYAALGRP
jgi:hypothetical protein